MDAPWVDFAYALPLGLIGGAVTFAALARRSSSAAPALAVAAMLALVLAAGSGHGFTGYRSDLWMYLTIAERVAAGEWRFDVDPYWLEPPGARTHSVQWLGLGLLARATGVPSAAWVWALTLASVALLSAAALRLGAAAFLDPRGRWIALVCFWAGFYQQWAVLALNRNVALGFALLATAHALDLRRPRRDGAVIAVSIALACYLHLFGGMLALGGVALATAARALRRAPLHAGALAASVAAGLALAAPWIWLALPEPGVGIAPEHLEGPGQRVVAGLRVFDPRALADFASPVLLVAAALAVLPANRAPLRDVATTFAWLAPLAVAVVLFAPGVYHVATGIVGGWMVPRSAVLACLFLPAAAALLSLAGPERSVAARALAAALCVALVWTGGARVVRDHRRPDLYAPFTAEARSEARALRDLLHRRMYLSTPYLAYGLAPFSLGHPLAVPPGHAPPTHPFGERARAARAVLRDGTPACWASLGQRFPELRFLVTPAEGAESEEGLWQAEVASRTPGVVAGELERSGAATRVHAGSHYVVHELDLAVLDADPSGCPDPRIGPSGP